MTRCGACDVKARASSRAALLGIRAQRSGRSSVSASASASASVSVSGWGYGCCSAGGAREWRRRRRRRRRRRVPINRSRKGLLDLQATVVNYVKPASEIHETPLSRCFLSHGVPQSLPGTCSSNTSFDKGDSFSIGGLCSAVLSQEISYLPARALHGSKFEAPALRAPRASTSQSTSRGCESRGLQLPALPRSHARRRRARC